MSSRKKEKLLNLKGVRSSAELGESQAARCGHNQLKK